MGEAKVVHSAFDTAIHYIAFKDRTVKEIQDKLREKGYSSHDIEKAIEKLSYYGYLNDENYALAYIRSNVNKKGMKRINMELLRKGIDHSVIMDASENIDADIDEVCTIQQMMERRYGDADFRDEKEKRRIYSFFIRRGFSYENISKAMENNRKMMNFI